MLVSVVLSAYSEHQTVVEFNFDIEDFTVVDDGGGYAQAYSTKFGDYYNLGDNVRIPRKSICIAIPGGMRIKEAYCDGDRVRVAENVRLKPTWDFLGSSGVADSTESVDSLYYAKCKDDLVPLDYAAMIEFGTISLVYYLLSPFQYDWEEKNLYFLPSLTLTLELEENPDAVAIDPEHPIPRLFLDLIDNPEDALAILSAYSDISPLDLDGNFDVKENTKANPIDYVIVCQEALADTYQKLIDWKRQKGWRCVLATVEDIEEMYPGMSREMQIKSYIKNLYEQNGVSFVLLGGDTSVIPAVCTYGKVTSKDLSTGKEVVVAEDKTIPADLFYGCFREPFDWDANGNGILGEADDNCVLYPQVLVTRVPLQLPTHVNIFINKLLAYEKKGNVVQKMLCAGSKLSSYVSDGGEIKSDAHKFGEALISTHIAKYWSGKTTTMFDTQDCVIDGFSLMAELQKNYSFVEIITHGEKDGWYFGTEDNTFTKGDAYNLISSTGGRIITTTACHVNAFDKESFYVKMDKSLSGCLSQAFLAGARNGVVAFVGSSREGWGLEKFTPTDPEMINPSVDYDGGFYRTLFEGIGNGSTHFGKLTTRAKNALYGMRDYPTYRWLQYSWNPMGDPEMPVFKTVPKVFSSVKVTRKSNGNIAVDTGVENCVICMTGETKGKYVQTVFRNVQNAEFTVSETNATICITKQDYIPYLIEGNDAISSAVAASTRAMYGNIETFALERSGNLTVECSVYDDASSAYLTLSDVIGNRVALERFSAEEEYPVNMDISGMSKGIYVLTLYVDDMPVDNRRVMKE